MRASSTPWPIISSLDIELEETDIKSVSKYARELVSKDPTLSFQSPFGDSVESGWRPGPTLYFEDHREIELTTEREARSYEYRSMSLAGDGDFILLSRPRVAWFESYLRDTLGLGSPTVLSIPQALTDRKRSLASACRNHRPAMDKLAKAARSANGMNVVPYLSNGNTWLLAHAISNEAGVKLRVASGPPSVTPRANNKLWFAKRVEGLLGPHSLPPTFRAFGPSSAAARLRSLAQRHKRVVLKTPSSVGGLGNIIFDSSDVLSKSLLELRDTILQSLRSIGWVSEFPVLIGVWESAVISSPSAQLWVPSLEDGPPIFEGSFEQKLQGATGLFVGAESADLPVKINRRLAREAVMLATLLQHLGYFGRVSFDGLLVGEDIGSAELRWIECNARWGGVSIPMTVAHRLGQGSKPLSYVIVQRVFDDQTEFTFDSVQQKLEEMAFSRQKIDRGIAWLTPPGDDEDAAIYVALAPTKKDAKAVAIKASQEFLIDIVGKSKKM